VSIPLVARDVIDYALTRRSVLVELFRGSSHVSDACDADPYLRLAAKFHGEATTRKCPVCRRKELVELRYTFGDELGQYSGRIKSIEEIGEMAALHGEFRVYTVEICRDCGWNHLVHSYLLGDGVVRKPPRKVRTLEDEWGR
jgi:hypothetical protein